jgi:hypothetical protein
LYNGPGQVVFDVFSAAAAAAAASFEKRLTVSSS